MTSIGDVAQLVRAWDRHAADAGSIPRCGKGFFSQSQLSLQTFLRCPHTPCAIACINICVHGKDPVVHVRVRWIKETLKTSSMHRGLGIATLSQLALPMESNPNFAMREIPSGQHSYTVTLIIAPDCCTFTFTSTFTHPLTARVVRTPQMASSSCFCQRLGSYRALQVLQRCVL